MFYKCKQKFDRIFSSPLYVTMHAQIMCASTMLLMDRGIHPNSKNKLMNKNQNDTRFFFHFLHFFTLQSHFWVYIKDCGHSFQWPLHLVIGPTTYTDCCGMLLKLCSLDLHKKKNDTVNIIAI